MHCDSCDQEKTSAGSALYGAYKLCNDCLLDFTLALASGRVENVVDYMTWKTEGPDGMPPSDLTRRSDRPAVSRTPLQAHDKLMPSN